jgi:hypothetical protein
MKSRVIDIRGTEEALYPIFSEWWAAHGWPGVPLAILPKCGVLVEEDDGTMVAVAFLYMDNSVGFSMMEWTVTNPKASPKHAYMAIAMLVQSVREVAISLDYGVVMTTAKQHALSRCYEKNGFAQTDTGMTHLIMFTKEGT